MKSFEQECREYLSRHSHHYYDNCDSGHRLDFSFTSEETQGKWFKLEVKEKRQHTKIMAWPRVDIQEEYIFILDDLSARKIFFSGPYSGLAVRDNLNGRYYFVDAMTLYMMPRRRVNRMVNPEKNVIKGKWMLDLRNMDQYAGVNAIIRRGVSDFFNAIRQMKNSPECWGNFHGETVGYGGEPRTQEQKDYDLKHTR